MTVCWEGVGYARLRTEALTALDSCIPLSKVVEGGGCEKGNEVSSWHDDR